MKKGISEIVGHTIEGNEPVYRALRPLLCAACGGEIPEGSLFTRHMLGQMRLLPHCQKCKPFSLEANKNSSSLLKALLSTQAETARSRKPRLTDDHADEIREAVEARLGPALKQAHHQSKTKWRSKR